ncbi:MAG: glycosyltransferase, partial [Chloroflexota bacterium]|nr:glycosyltransferase [Chloroflexota bacterium]
MSLLPLVVGAAYGAWTSWRSNANYVAVARLAPDATSRAPAEWPFVSIIIPARNEAHNLPLLLTSLARRATPARPQPLDSPLSPDPPEAAGGMQATPPHEVVVVDDASSDATGEIATALGARVLRLEEDERHEGRNGDRGGWMGKPYACWQGAMAARGEWLLFLDADTTLGPDALGDTLSHALAQGVDALSILLQQRCDTFWERLLLPFAYQQLFAGIGREGLGSGAAQGAMLNGQFILIRRAAYAAVGGHGAVRDSIAEDVALARVLT